jgi:hypothetical protein
MSFVEELGNFQEEAKTLLKQYEEELKNHDENLKGIIECYYYAFKEISQEQDAIFDLTSKIREIKEKLKKYT